MSRTTIQLGVLGAVLLALAVAGLALHLPPTNVGLNSAQRDTVVVILLLAGLAYFVSVFVVLRHSSSRASLWIVLGVAAAMRLVFVFDHPVLSSDVYRYVWDGQVQSAGVNPYRYVPADPALKHLRDAKVFPLINRANYAHTIYPPAAQVIFAAVGWVSSSVTAMKLAMVAFEVLACWCLLQLLHLAQLPAERLLIYAWNPLSLWSFAYDGHVDAAAIGLLSLALLYRARHRDTLAGAVLAVASLVKFFPVVVAPAFVRGGKFWRPALAGSLVIGSLYGLYASAGSGVFGFLSGYSAEEGLATGDGVWLLSGVSYLNDHTDLVDLPDTYGLYFLVGAAIGLIAFGVWVARRVLPAGERDVVMLCRDTAILAATAMILVSPHYPWYFAWLALPSVIAPLRSVIWLSVASMVLYIHPETDFALWGSVVYLPALAFAGFEFWNARRVSGVLAPI
jgi:hypothetical protein